jgi:hypothetical protein
MTIPKKIASEPAKKRILNEITAKVQNEQTSDQITDLRRGSQRSDWSEIQFSCECDTRSCPEHIAMSTQEYANVHLKNMHFIVVPSHVRLDIEEVITSFKSYCVVKKVFPVLGAV